MAQSTEDIEYDISAEFLAWSMLQDPEANNMTDTNTSAPTLETFPVPSGSSSQAFTFNPPYTEHSNAQAAGGPLNITTGLAQGPMPVTGDGPEVSTEVNLVPEIEPVSQKFKRSARTKDKSQKPKRARAPNWDDSEKLALLVLKLEALKRATLMKYVRVSSSSYRVNDNHHRCQLTTYVPGSLDNQQVIFVFASIDA